MLVSLLPQGPCEGKKYDNVALEKISSPFASLLFVYPHPIIYSIFAEINVYMFQLVCV